MNKKRVNIGFDIGITSVGWSIVDENNNIVDRGVRLFDELKNPKDGKLENEVRRSKRSLRRTLRRRRNRKDDFIKLIFNKYNDIFKLEKKDSFEENKKIFFNTIINNHTNISIFDLVLKGLKTEINPKELLRVLYYYLGHRGYSYMTEEQYKNKNNNFEIIYNDSLYKEFAELVEKKFDLKKDKEIILEKIKNEINFKSNFKTEKSFFNALISFNKDKEYYGLFPSEIQKKEFDKNGYIRGNNKNAEFSIFNWKEEIEKLLSNQSYINNDFINDYCLNKNSVFSRIRDFSEGPGSKKSPSIYGLYHIENNKVVKKWNRLWDKLIGKCSVYVDEPRANKKSTSAELSNILNQLNTLHINDNSREYKYLTKDEKKEIIFKSISEKKIINPNFISKIIKLDDWKKISKYPTKISKKELNSSNEDKSNFEELKNTKLIFSLFNDFLKIKNYDDLILKLNLFNEVIDIFAMYISQIKRIEESLCELLKEFNLNNINELTKELISKIDAKSTSSMSIKALNKYIFDEIITSGITLNQKFKKIIDENRNNTFQFKDESKYINFKCMDDEIMSPTTKCSFRETLKVFNKILKKYIYNGEYNLKNIVIEMPTEWNSVEERKRQTDIKNNNKQKKMIAKENYGYDGDDKKIIEKLVLLHSQDGIDVYTGSSLDANKIINDASYAQIDHIIPYSISYDDSFNNKVIVHSSSNQEKGQRTPRQYLSNDKYYSLEKKWKDIFLSENNGLFNKRKYENLTIFLDENDPKQIGFIGRNLSDTRYACRIANQAINAWLDVMKKNNKINLLSNEDVNVINVNGKYTQRYRSSKFLNIKKDRDLDYSHHAIDATICAILGNNNKDVEKLIWFKKVDKETGEVTNKSWYVHDFDKIKKSDSTIEWKKISNNVKNFPVKFSHKLTKKNNFGLWGDTIVSVIEKDKDEFYKNNYINLLSIDKYIDIKKKIDELNKHYENGKNYPDPKLWKDLMMAWEEGENIRKENKEYESKNPFKLYMQNYCSINNINDSLKEKWIILNRNGYIYKVSRVSIPNEINSFYKIKKLSKDNKFGAYTSLDWKEIKLFIDKKGKYRLLSMRPYLYKHNFIEIDNEVFNKEKEKYNINIDSNPIYTIHRGTLLVNKNDIKDVWKVVGIDMLSNRLEIKPIYKKIEKRNIISISTILDDYDFCTVDVLGNLSIVKLENK